VSRGLLIAAGVAIVAIAAGALMLMGSKPEAPAADPAKAASPGPSRPSAPTEAPKAAPAPATAPAVARAPRKALPATAEPAPAAPAAPTLATLTVESDVPGASVFIDRQYAGNTPLTVDKLDPGTKILNLSADGHSGIQKSVDLVAGPNTVTLKFKEVRLNAKVGVVHKHGMGSCDGALVATVDGLAYDTSNKGDAFSVPFAQLDTFAVDYLQKNLRVKLKSGRTFNFTDKNPTPDTLFVFHRDVEAARKKLADGYTAVK